MQWLKENGQSMIYKALHRKLMIGQYESHKINEGSLPVFRGVRVTRSLVLCRLLFVLLSFFFWPSCCLSFFDLRILTTSLWYLQTLFKQFLLHWRRPLCYSCYKSGDKLWMSKGHDCDYDKWNIHLIKWK